MENRRIIWHDDMHCDVEQHMTDADGNDIWAVVACYNMPTTGEETMSAPNHGGYTESDERIALRNERNKARGLAAELKPEMENFLNAVGEAVDQPLTVLHRELNAEPQTLSEAVAWAYGHPAEPEAEAQAAQVVRDTEWLGEAEADAQEFRDVKFGSKQWFDGIDEIPF